MPSPEVLYLHLNGEQRGPYTISQIDHLLNSGLITEETLFWREGLEQWQPVTHLVALRRAPNRWKKIGIAVAIIIPLVLIACLFGPPLADGWREATSNEFTVEDAYWRGRDFVRHQAVPAGTLVTFEHFNSAGVELLKSDAANVVLRGQLTPSGARPRAVTWHVHLRYDRTKREWTSADVKEEVADL